MRRVGIILLLIICSHPLFAKIRVPAADKIRAREFVAAHDSIRRADRDDIILMLLDSAVYYCNKDDFDIAESYAMQSIYVSKNIFGEYGVPYTLSITILGNIYRNTAAYDKAEKCYKEGIHMHRLVFLLDSNPFFYGVSLNNLGLLYSDQGKYKKAIKCFSQALPCVYVRTGPNDSTYCSLLNNLGLAYKNLGDFEKAEYYYSAVLAMPPSVSGANRITSLTGMGVLSCSQGDYKQAEKYYLEAVRFSKEEFGEKSLKYAHATYFLSEMYLNIGDYEKAESYLLTTLQIRKDILGENHDDYAETLRGYSMYLQCIGDYEKAEQLLQQALQICQEVHGERHPMVAAILNDLGIVCEHRNKYKLAEECFIKALDIEKGILRGEHYQMTSTLNNLGMLYLETREYEKAESYLSQSLQITEKAYGKKSPENAMILNNIAYLCSQKGDFKKAEKYYLQALSIDANTKGINSNSYLTTSSNLGWLYYDKKDYSSAKKYFQQNALLYKEHFLSTTNFMSEQQRDHYRGKMRMVYERSCPLLTYRAYPSDASLGCLGYDNELFYKGLLLTTSNAIRRSVLESGDTLLIQQWEMLASMKQQMMVLEEKDPQSPYLEKLRRETESLEKEVTRTSAAYRENLRQWNITWDSVRSVLKPNQVAIEFMSASLKRDSSMYCALLLRDTCSLPIMIPLFEEKEVAGSVDVSTPFAIDRIYAYDGYGKQLSHIVWEKLKPYVRPGDEVFFAPTGVLHLLAIENLPYDNAHTMADIYRMIRLSSTRELVLNKQAISHQQATLYGGIYYQQMDSATMSAMSGKYKQRDMAVSFANDTTKRALANYLPGTKKEIEEIQSILQGQKIEVSIYSNDTACEESVKSLSGKQQNILHLATHGFFWEKSTITFVDAMDCCGLLFAGANMALAGNSARIPKGVDDGILTAKEISLLDFRKADIVVLSACETARGDISGEGVFGLQRAFKMAGAQTILMALWKVDDAATQMLMTSFYRNLSAGQSKREAFRNAQQTVRNYEEKEIVTMNSSYSAADKYKKKGKSVSSENREESAKTIITHPYQSPYYWAGFILLD